MKMFVLIVAALFCGAGAGAVTVHFVCQQRIEAEKEVERERIEAGRFTDEEMEIYLRIVEWAKDLYSNVNQIEWEEYKDQINAMSQSKKKVLAHFIAHYVENKDDYEFRKNQRPKR